MYITHRNQLNIAVNIENYHNVIYYFFEKKFTGEICHYDMFQLRKYWKCVIDLAFESLFSSLLPE